MAANIVFLHLRLREHERRAVVVEAVLAQVLGKARSEVAMHVEEVSDRVRILDLIQSPQHNFATGSFQFRHSTGEFALDPCSDFLDF